MLVLLPWASVTLIIIEGLPLHRILLILLFQVLPHSLLSEILFECIFHTESVSLVHRHCNHDTAKYQEDDTGCDLSSWRLVKHEVSQSSDTKFDMGVVCRAELDLYLVKEVDLLLVLSRVIQNFPPLYATISGDLPPLALCEIEQQANPVELIIIDTLVVSRPESVMLTSLWIF